MRLNPPDDCSGGFFLPIRNVIMVTIAYRRAISVWNLIAIYHFDWSMNV